MMPDWVLVLEASAFTAFLRDAFWTAPVLRIIHLVGLALLVGAATFFDLRLLGLAKKIEVSSLSKFLLPWAWVGLGLSIVSGLLMFATHPTELFVNVAFRVKLVLIVLAGINVLVFHRFVYPQSSNTNVTKLSAAVSLSVWLSVVVLGRLIGYT